MGSVEVYILGQKYVIKGEEPAEHVQKLAEYVDSKLKEVHSSVPGVTPLKAAILAALTIADELHKVKGNYESVSQSIRSIEDKADTIIKLFE